MFGKDLGELVLREDEALLMRVQEAFSDRLASSHGCEVEDARSCIALQMLR